MDNKPRARDSARAGANEAAAEKQRELQREQDRKEPAESGAGGAKEQGAPQTSSQKYPEELPAQHLQKPGLEAEMQLKPQFYAPGYRGSGKLKGMVALITGGDSGIGRAVAVLYAREGADVAIVYLSSHEDAEETKRHVEQEGRQCLLIPGDVKDSRFCKEAVEKTVQEFDRLDILVNNAAFQEHAHSLEDVTDERMRETFETNIMGYMRMARAAVPHMKQGACIINTSSVTGLRGSARLLDYSATKGAINAFTMSLASALIDRGIRVNAIAPGPVWTPLNPADQSAKEIVEFGKKTDFKRPAQPEELSPAYVFLASPVCSSYITGMVMPITGSVGG